MDIDKMAATEASEPLEGNSRYNEQYTFSVSCEHAGKRLEGTFTNRILSNNDRIKVANFAAKMREGAAFESLRPEAREFQEAVAHLLVSLSRDDRPKWAENLGALQSDDAIWEIYAEVAKHEATFRGPRPDPKARQEGGGAEQPGSVGEDQSAVAAAVG